MKLALVIGSTISTIKDENLTGRKLLIVREADTDVPFIMVSGAVGEGMSDVLAIVMNEDD